MRVAFSNGLTYWLKRLADEIKIPKDILAWKWTLDGFFMFRIDFSWPTKIDLANLTIFNHETCRQNNLNKSLKTFCFVLFFTWHLRSSFDLTWFVFQCRTQRVIFLFPYTCKTSCKYITTENFWLVIDFHSLFGLTNATKIVVSCFVTMPFKEDAFHWNFIRFLAHSLYLSSVDLVRQLILCVLFGPNILYHRISSHHRNHNHVPMISFVISLMYLSVELME